MLLLLIPVFNTPSVSILSISQVALSVVLLVKTNAIYVAVLLYPEISNVPASIKSHPPSCHIKELEISAHVPTVLGSLVPS